MIHGERFGLSRMATIPARAFGDPSFPPLGFPELPCFLALLSSGGFIDIKVKRIHIRTVLPQPEPADRSEANPQIVRRPNQALKIEYGKVYSLGCFDWSCANIHRFP